MACGSFSGLSAGFSGSSRQGDRLGLFCLDLARRNTMMMMMMIMMMMMMMMNMMLMMTSEVCMGIVAMTLVVFGLD